MRGRRNPIPSPAVSDILANRSPNNTKLLVSRPLSSVVVPHSHCIARSENLVEYIIGLFNKSESAQLIYTTHNTYLLNTNKLRKDQIYFVNKRDDGSSDLYSLFDYKDFRDGLDAEKAYLQGRFDAIPYIDEQVDSVIK